MARDCYQLNAAITAFLAKYIPTQKPMKATARGTYLD
jgi:hypothetical protein